MSHQVICLSDSDESVRTETNEEHDDLHRYEEPDFSFPAVGFAYHTNQPTNVINKNQSDKNTEKAPVQTSTGRINPADDYIVRTANLQTESSSSKQISDNNKKTETRAQQIAKEKNLKARERKNLKKIQPGECMKFMSVRLDQGLQNDGFLDCIVSALLNYEISGKLESLLVANSIMWTRRDEENDDSNKSCSEENENHIIIIWTCKDAVGRIEDGSFVSSVEFTLSLVPGLQPTLILYGMEEYFRDNKRGKKQNSGKSNLPKISRQDLEICLAEIQISFNCGSQLVDTLEDLGALVYRFTKSIAEKPYKMEKKQKLAEKLDWYASGDKRDTVRVDSNSNGLRRLWQQQLCQFNLASLETAEAIASIYPSPVQLMEAYKNCANNEGEKLLKDIPIRRAAGHLSTVRKIGPELSKKIFIMFTSKDGEAVLGNEKEL